MTARCIHLLITLRWPLLIGALVVAVFAYRTSTQLSFDRSIENMFAPSDPLLVPFHKLKRTFGGNEIVLAVYDDPELLAPSGEGLARLKQVSAALRDTPGVRDVLSLAEVNQTLEQLGGASRFFGGWQGPAILDPKSELSAAYRDLFVGYTHGSDGRTVAIAVMLIPGEDTDVPRQQTIDALRTKIEQLPDELPPGMLAGEPVMVSDGFRYLEADGQRLAWTSTLLLAIVILVCFRSIRWVLIPLAVVQWSLIVTQAVLVWSGMQLSMVSSMLTAIVTVVGVATVVHIIVRMREHALLDDVPGADDARDATEQGRGVRGALAAAGVLLLAPIVWSCVTDAVGFGSLLSARVGPVQDFGLMTALGALMVLVAVGALVPGLALLGKFDARPQRAWGEDRLERQLTRLMDWVEHHPRPLIAVMLIGTVLAVIGSWRTEVETDFTKNFRAHSPVVRSYAYIEDRLGGAGVWDVIVPAPKTLTREYLASVLALEDELRALRFPSAPADAPPALTKVLSLADADLAAQASVGLRLLPPEQRAQGMRAIMPTFTDALRSSAPDEGGHHYLRIMLRAREREPAANKKWLIDEVTRLSRDAFPPEGTAPGAEVTGFYVLLTNLIDSLLADQWRTFGLASLGIGLMLVIALRDVKLALIAIIPNALPIFFTLGLMGWLGMVYPGLKLNMGAAMIAAVSMGLSVDSSIHYLLSYQRARRQGLEVVPALHVAQQGVGRALVFSTLALIVGFSVLALSEFIPTVYFGVLVSLAMLGGLLGNLLVLPLLVRITTR
jgi:predicted RND superfamily exporter protein